MKTEVLLAKKEAELYRIYSDNEGYHVHDAGDDVHLRTFFELKDAEKYVREGTQLCHDLWMNDLISRFQSAVDELKNLDNYSYSAGRSNVVLAEDVQKITTKLNDLVDELRANQD